MSDPQTLAGGRYLLVKRLGEGGMATVWRAFDQRLQVWRAIKVLLPEFSRKAKLMARFEAEAQTMALLEHPNIVRVYDVDRDDEHAFIVMELVEGGSLVDWLEAHGPMPSRLAVDVMVEICQALQFAHGKGVIHRDIKPHNVLVDRDGCCRLTDFGIARAGDTDASLTKTGAVMGTWGYMAPEQRTDAKHVDERADIYAMAATLYSLITDKQPVDLFAADHDDSMLDGVPAPLVPLLVKATDYRKERRFGSADELAAALLEVRDRLPEDPAGTPSLRRDVSPLPAPDRAAIERTAAVQQASATLLPDFGGSETVGEAFASQIEGTGREVVGGGHTGFDLPAGAEGTSVGSTPAPRAQLMFGLAVALLLIGLVFASLATRGAPTPAPAPTPVGVAVAPVSSAAPDLAMPGHAVDGQMPTAALSPPVEPVRLSRSPSETSGETNASTPGSEQSAKATESVELVPEPPKDPSEPPPKVSQCFETVELTTAEAGKPLGFRAKTCKGANARATVFYRAIGSSAWSQRQMAYRLGRQTAAITLDGDLSRGIEYYLESEGVTHGSAGRPQTAPVR